MGIFKYPTQKKKAIPERCFCGMPFSAEPIGILYLGEIYCIKCFKSLAPESKSKLINDDKEREKKKK